MNNQIYTKFRPIDLINNTSDDIYQEVVKNINKKYKNKSYLEVKSYEKGMSLRLKPGVFRAGKILNLEKIKVNLFLYLLILKRNMNMVYY